MHLESEAQHYQNLGEANWESHGRRGKKIFQIWPRALSEPFLKNAKNYQVESNQFAHAAARELLDNCILGLIDIGLDSFC